MPIYYGIDSWYLILVVPALLITLFAQIKVKSTFSKYSSRRIGCGMTGRQASEYIQRQYGISTGMARVSGSMTDCYDPKTNSIHLSDTVCDQPSVAAVGVAAHETGHAIQYAENYLPVRLRMSMVPVTNFASGLSPWLVLIGLVLNFTTLAYAGVVLFGVAVLFQLVTLPVEFNASARAVKALEESGQLTDDELRGVRKVLSAAAMTYVASLLVSLASMLRLLLIVSGRRNNNRR